jgi:hypothetical protein
MDISAFKEAVLEQHPVVFDSFEKTELTQEVIHDLDKPIIDKLSIKEELKPLSNEHKGELKELGYSESVIDAIGSKEEADIYSGAKLECETTNEKDTLIRTDIDLECEDDFGNTNLERMEKGLSPLDKDGRSFELHHIGQTADAPLAELTKTEHMSNGNNSILHDTQKESEIDRKEFDKERAEHWKARAEDIKQEQNSGLNNE